MTYKEKTAERLLQLRTEQGLTQKELAEKVNTSPQNIDLYESGKRKINVEILGKIADVYNVSTDYLLGRTKTKTLNEDIKAVCEITGLSERSINRLNFFSYKHFESTSTLTEFFDKMISSNDFQHILIGVSRYKSLTTEYVKSIIDGKTEEANTILDKIDLEKFRILEELKDFLEEEFSNHAFIFSREYHNNFLTLQISENGNLYLPLVPPAPLRPMLPPYPESLPIEQVEELRKNEPTQNEIDRYNERLEMYKKSSEIAKIYMQHICQEYEKSRKEIEDNNKHNTPKE